MEEIDAIQSRLGLDLKLIGKELIGKELIGKELIGKELIGKELIDKAVYPSTKLSAR